MLGVGIEIENFKKSCTFFYICTTLERLKKSDVALISTLCDDFVQENGGERCDYLSAYENAPGILQSAGALGSAERWVPARASIKRVMNTKETNPAADSNDFI